MHQVEKTCQADPQAWHKVLLELSTQGKPGPILLCLEKMSDLRAPINAEHRECLFQSCSISKDSKSAHNYFMKCLPTELNDRLIKLALLACGSAGDFETSKKIIERVRELKRPVIRGFWVCLNYFVACVYAVIILMHLILYTNPLFLLLNTGRPNQRVCRR